MSRQVTAYRWVPPFAQGFVRDLRVRWALEEAGLPYEVVLLDFETVKSAAHRQWQPFGQVPAYRDDQVTMFESGAIVLHVASQSEALAPADPAGRARVATWVLAALNSVEPFVQNLNFFDGTGAGDDWVRQRKDSLRGQLRERLAALANWLGDKPYLEGRFSAGDLMMTTVLREAATSGLLQEFPRLDAYRERCVQRPAFERALQAQLQAFRDHAPKA